MMFELGQVVAHYDFLGQQITELDQQLQKRMAAMPGREVARSTPVETENPAAEAPQKKRRGRPRKERKLKKPPKNAPAFDMDAEMDLINLRRDEFHGEWNYEIVPRR